VVVADSTGARTSAVARLYVVRPGVVTANVVLDNFNDNKLTGWTFDGHKGQAKLTETNQQFKVWGYWPGVHTVDFGDTAALGILSRTWSVTNGQTGMALSLAPCFSWVVSPATIAMSNVLEFTPRFVE
jgi:hypothetical protein